MHFFYHQYSFLISFPVPLDLGFLIDGSSAVGNEMNFNQILLFVMNFIQMLTISPQFTRVGIVVYSYQPMVMMTPNAEANKHSLMHVVSHIPFPGRTSAPGACIGRGLNAAKHYIFSESDNANSRPKVLVVVTAGLSCDDVFGPTQDLRTAGVDVFVVNLGNLRSEFQMHAIGSDPLSEHIFSASFSQVAFLAENILHKIMKGKRGIKSLVSYIRFPV